MKTYLVIFTSILIITSLSCGSSFKSYDNGSFDETKSSVGYLSDDAREEPESTAPQTDSESDFPDIQANEKVIKTANLSIEVENYDSSAAYIRKIVEANGAFISNENQEHGTYQIYNTFTIRTPKDKFDALIAQIEKTAMVVFSKNVNVQDVTEEYVDIETRLKTKKEVEARYIELLKQSKSISDILNVENQLRVIREEIEAKEGRMKFLNSQVSYSTITLYVYQKYDSPYEPGFFGKMGKAFNAGWNGLKLLVIGLVYLWPLWILLGGGLAWLLIYLKRNRKKK